VLHDAATAECLVYTFREGLLSAVGHDLCLRVERFAVEITGDASAPSILARFDAASLRVTGDVSPADARKIEGHAAGDVLAARKFPTIELHISNPVRRGPVSDTATVSLGMVTGFGIAGYYLALRGLRDMLAK